jgi:hypothetical protein
MTGRYHGDNQDADLKQLKRQYRHWRIWRGSDIGELARRLAQPRDGMACELGAAGANEPAPGRHAPLPGSLPPAYPIRPIWTGR